MAENTWPKEVVVCLECGGITRCAEPGKCVGLQGSHGLVVINLYGDETLHEAPDPAGQLLDSQTQEA